VHISINGMTRTRTFPGSSNPWFEDIQQNCYQRYIIIEEEEGGKGEKEE
jgi:hypothetical protein